MSSRNVDSPWREKRFEWHGEAVWEFLQQEMTAGEPFTVRDAAQADCLQHLSPRYGYDVAVAVCHELYQRKILQRQGNAYVIPRRRHAA